MEADTHLRSYPNGWERQRKSSMVYDPVFISEN